MDTPPQQPPVNPPQKKKGLHPMAWVGIGCGGLLIIAVIAVVIAAGWVLKKADEFAANPSKTAAETIVAMSPDIEKVSENDDAGEMTIRVKETGEELTISYGDIASGKFTVESSDGSTMTIGMLDESKIPSWVPQYPNIRGSLAGSTEEKPSGVSGVITFTTDDSAEDVESFYEDKLASIGSHSHSTTTFGSKTSMQHSFSGGGQDIEVLITSGDSASGTQVTVTYSGN